VTDAAGLSGETTPRFGADELRTFAATLLERAGLPGERARTVADVLLEGDLLGHSTHGLDLLAAYLREVDAGRMAREGGPEILSDLGAVMTWDGRYLPGPWLVTEAIARARGRLSTHHLVTVVIRRSHHIACLQAYLKPVTDAGLVLLLMSSDPAAAGVTPHGGVASRLTPNPIAAGIPTDGDPMLIDVSMSTTTNAMTRRVAGEGGRLAGEWVVDADGAATDDPSVLFGERRGALLPLGGLDLGHKGFALALIVEALTSGLAGHGRADEPHEWGASVFVQLIDPEAFGGRVAFTRETSRLAEICRSTPVAAGRPPVRLPGEAALARRRRQLREGVTLHPSTLPALVPWAERFGVPLPAPVS
jgi:LDH2 family malate/lactate/ureidoglycolate dehydrogenase